jgi:hypothetical protein
MNGRRATQLLALFILLYALADVSVLQAYCGNESMGIPPDHHSVLRANDSAQSEHDTCSESGKADCRQTPDEKEYDHHHECFCWHQIIVGFYHFNPVLFTESLRTQPSVSYDEQYSDSSLTHLFRPPQLA